MFAQHGVAVARFPVRWNRGFFMAGWKRMSTVLQTLIIALVGLSLVACSRPEVAALPPKHTVIAQVEPLPGLKVRPLTDRVFERTEERRLRGRYLAEGILACEACHSDRDPNQPGGPPVVGKAYAGTVWNDDGKARLVAANLTSDPETGVGRWSDDMLARAIREGIGHDGRLLHPQMYYRTFRMLSDEDLAAVVVFIRSLPPVRNPLPKSVLTADQVKRYVSWPQPVTAPVPAPPQGTQVERGRYLAAIGDCSGCHTLWDGKRLPGAYAGGNEVGRNGREVFSANITPHATGMPYDAGNFIQIMRTGKSGLLDPIMPWWYYRRLNDGDLKALHAFLGTRHGVAHRISNLGEKSECVVCGQSHGLGKLNALPRHKGVEVSTALLREYTGTYRIDEFDWTVQVELIHGKLHARESGGAPPKELVPLSEELFAMDGGLGPLRFARNEAGQVDRVISEDVDDTVLRRIAAAGGAQ